MGNKFCGDYMLDQIMDGSYTGWSRTAVSQEFQDESARVMTAYLEYSQPNGAGGSLLTGNLCSRTLTPGSEFYCWKLSAAHLAVQATLVSVLCQPFRALAENC